MGERARQVYEFGPFAVDAAGGLLTRGGQPVPVTPKALDTLVALVERGGDVLTKDELMRRVWGDTFVEENNLSQNISLLRKALDDGTGYKYIETIPRRGYRFAGTVTLRPAPPAAPPACNARRSCEMFCERLFSSTKLSGQTRRISSSLPRQWPLFSTSATSVSNAFGVSGTGCPSRSSSPSRVSTTKGPNR